MAISNRNQRIVLTAVPQGYLPSTTGGADSVVVGVHVSPRLSYDGPAGSATLASFPDWATWPSVSLSWSCSFDEGKTWVKPTRVVDEGSTAFWQGTFPSSLPVRSFTGDQPGGSAYGYSYATVAKSVLQAYAAPTLGATPIGSAARAALKQPQSPGRTVTSDPATELARFAGFYQPASKQGARAGSLKPDFHGRLALLGDHAALLRRLGVVVHLVLPVPANVSSVTVRATRRAGTWKVPTRFLSPHTAASLVPLRRSFLPAVGDPFAPWLSPALKLRLDTSRFSVHSLDVDSAAAQVMGVASSPNGLAKSPPVGRSAGLTVAMASHAQFLSNRISGGKAAAGKLLQSPPVMPTLRAEEVISGFHAQVGTVNSDGIVTWRGIGNRGVEYSTDTASAGSFTAVDTAPITTAPRAPDPKDPTHFYVSDVIARWDGWSIAVPHPGRHRLQTGAVTESLREAPPQAPDTTLHMRAFVPEQDQDGADGRLPLLRYGRDYRVRMRAVTVTGYAPPWQGAPESPTTRYYRWDPAPAPLVLAPQALTRTETARVLVVRSNPYAGETIPARSSRTLVPPSVAVDVGLLHGAFDDESGVPSASSWSSIAALDSASPPKYAPAYSSGGAAPDEPSPLVVDWLPDPMTPATYLELPGVGWRDVSFLPPGASPSGLAEIGGWQSVAVQLVPVSEAEGYAVGDVEEGTGQRVVRFSVPPAGVATVRLRAEPGADTLRGHGLLTTMTGTEEERVDAVGAGDAPLLTPSTEIELVHAVRQPLSDPVLGAITVFRGLGVKDARIRASAQFDPASTGGLSVIASWEEWRDEADGRQPRKVEVPYTPVYDAQLTPGADKPSSRWIDERPPMPDLRRRDLVLRPVATSCFVPHFRTSFPVTFTTPEGGGSRTFYDLPADADVESLEVSTTTGTLVRGVDYRVETSPVDGRRTISVPVDQDVSKLRIDGVHGSVLAPTNGDDGETYTVIVPSAVRPSPPKPAYAVPSFPHEPATPGVAGYSTSRGRMSVRIWLERPWWSSGDEEGLAVITKVVPADSSVPTTTALDRLVTTYAADPTVRPSGTVARTMDLPSGVPVTNLTVDEDLPEAERLCTLNARVHEVVFDPERNLYAAEVTLPDVPSGTFVRLAIARYQPQMGPTGVGEDEIVRISRIVALDPIQVLPERTTQVRSALDGRAVEVRVGGPSHTGADAQHLPFVRVSLQSKSTGGSDVGWTTEAHAEADLDPTTRTYPAVQVVVPDGITPSRVLVEELERWTVVDGSGNPTTAPPYQQEPTTTARATADLTGVKPVYVATSPMP